MRISDWSSDVCSSELLHAFAEAPEPLGDGREAVAVRTPLVLVPPAADAHLGASARDDVDGGGDLRQIRRVAVAHARAHLSEADAEIGRASCRERVCQYV